MKVAAILLAFLASGCTDRRSVEFYTKPEVDAINAEAECKRLARTTLQMNRCEVRR